MNTKSIVVACVLSLFLGCVKERPDPDRLAKATKTREEATAQLRKEAQLLEAASKNIAERLKKMNVEDQATVAALIMMMDATRSLDGKSMSLRKETATRMADNIGSVSPMIGKAWSGSSIIGGCMDESIAYVSALAKCNKDGKTEDKCLDAQVAAAGEITCMMKQMEALRRNVFEIFKGLKPPRPTPWPEM